MPTLPARRRAPLLIALVSASVSLAAGCGGSTKAGPTGPTGAVDDATTAALGTTGLEALDWGASAETVVGAFASATPTDGGLWATGMTDGHTSITKFTIGADGLSQVDVEWTEGYPSMDDCAKGWREIRAKVDARLGPSTEDNLAAYWNTATASVILACNPNDDGSGVLSQNFAPRQPE